MVEPLSSAFKVLSRRKVTSTANDVGLRFQKSLSVVDITCLGLSTTIGTGIFTILAFAAKDNAGPSVVLSFLIAAVASCLGGLCYSELSSRFPEGGPAYTYVYATLGEFPAFIIGWSMILEYIIGNALAAKSLIDYLDTFSNSSVLHALRVKTNIFQSVPGFEHTHIDFASVLIIILVAYILMKSIKISCILNNIFVFLCFLVIAGIVMVSMFDMDAENWTAGQGFFPNGVVGIFSAASTCFFAFHGYDIIASTAGESSNRIRVVPVAISLAFLLGLLACFMSSISITLLIPSSLLDCYAPLLNAFEVRSLHGMQYLVIIGAITGLMATLTATSLAMSRLLFFMSEDGLILPFLSKYDRKNGTTSVATVITCLLSSVIALCFQRNTLFQWLGMGSLITYLSVSLSILALRYSVTERLPIEISELQTPESSVDNFRTVQQTCQSMQRSMSDCFLNHRLSDIKSKRCDCSPPPLNEQTCNELHTAIGALCAIDSYNCHKNYGTVRRPRIVSVDYINDEFVTSISNSQTNKESPTQQTAKHVAVYTSIMMFLMLVMGLFTIHVPRILPAGSEWWMELVSTLMFIFILICVVFIVRKPQHECSSRNSIPCVPLLPICAIWMDIHLIICLPYSSWLASLLWSLLGIFVYMSYSVWHSDECLHNTDNCEDSTDLGLNGTVCDEEQEIISYIDDTIDGTLV